ncbi:MAG TPA: PLP-dependent lyase/thiolase [Candidatus Dormibacteraeota bacterium]|nr:PLP-dependent lyase/thiolase [Candidatus Dormibacteraeota bacterium]
MASSETGDAVPPGQWIHSQLFGVSLAPASRLSLGEGGTALEPAPELGRALGIPDLLLKREDQSPTGSHKARCLSLLCSALVAGGGRQAVISSSGNAAVAAAAYAALGDVRLLSLVSPRTPRVKLNRLRGYPGLIVLSEHPVALLHHAVGRWGLADLRGSANLLAPNAYRGIAAELVASAPGAVFLFTSSGATALGLGQGFDRLLPPQQRPELHVVEGTPGGEITRSWYRDVGRAEETAGGLGELGARRSRLAPAVRRAVRSSGGRGWRVAPAEATELRALAETHGVRTSWEGIATLAAMRQAGSRGEVRKSGSWVAILTGDQAQLDLEPSRAEDPPLAAADSGAELDRLLEGAGFTRTEAS